MAATIGKAIRIYAARRKCPAVCANTVDPITQEEVASIATPVNFFFGNARAFVCVDAVATAKYIIATGDTKNAITRQEINIVELRRLDKLTKGRCESVLENLTRAKARACQAFEHAQLCQAMETEPAELWSFIMSAPFSSLPHLTITELEVAVPAYAVLIREYESVSLESSRQFHQDNLRNLRCLDIKCGDAVVYEHVFALLREVMPFATQPQNPVSGSEDENTGSDSDSDSFFGSGSGSDSESESDSDSNSEIEVVNESESAEALVVSPQDVVESLESESRSIVIENAPIEPEIGGGDGALNVEFPRKRRRVFM